jgi:hypothetical protein
LSFHEIAHGEKWAVKTNFWFTIATTTATTTTG